MSRPSKMIVRSLGVVAALAMAATLFAPSGAKSSPYASALTNLSLSEQAFAAPPTKCPKTKCRTEGVSNGICDPTPDRTKCGTPVRNCNTVDC